jgi:hypothetical protein
MSGSLANDIIKIAELLRIDLGKLSMIVFVSFEIQTIGDVGQLWVAVHFSDAAEMFRDLAPMCQLLLLDLPTALSGVAEKSGSPVRMN